MTEYGQSKISMKSKWKRTTNRVLEALLGKASDRALL